jgi:hypothetical protein
MVAIRRHHLPAPALLSRLLRILRADGEPPNGQPEIGVV